jgi:hypothetical protein
MQILRLPPSGCVCTRPRVLPPPSPTCRGACSRRSKSTREGGTTTKTVATGAAPHSHHPCTGKTLLALSAPRRRRAELDSAPAELSSVDEELDLLIRGLLASFAPRLRRSREGRRARIASSTGSLLPGVARADGRRRRRSSPPLSSALL